MRGLAVVVAAVLLGATSCGGGGPSEADYVDALAAAFEDRGGGGLDEEQAACAAQEVVTLVGVDELDAEGVEPEDLPGEDADDLGLDPADDGPDVLDDCEVDVDDIDAARLDGLAGELVGGAVTVAYADALAAAATLDGSGTDLDDGERDCVAAGVVAALGIDGLAGFGTPSEVEEAQFLAELGAEFDGGAAAAFGRSVQDCADLRALALETIDVPTDQAECLLDAVGPDVIDQVAYADALNGGSGDGLPDDIQQLIGAVFEDCAGPGAEAFIEVATQVIAQDPSFSVSEDAARCVAEEWIGQVGVDRFVDLGIEPDDLTGQSLGGLGLVDADIEPLFDAYGDCGVDVLEPFMFGIATGSGLTLTPEQEACIRAATDVGALRSLFVATVLGEDITAEPAFSELVDALSSCVGG